MKKIKELYKTKLIRDKGGIIINRILEIFQKVKQTMAYVRNASGTHLTQQ